MSLILRYVNVTFTCVNVEEAFLGFLNVDDTTGQGLFDVTHDKLKSLGLNIDDIRDSQDVLLSADESFKVNYFLYIVDQAIASLATRFEQYHKYENIFGFLFTSDKLKFYDDDSLMACCSLLELKKFLKIKLLKSYLRSKMSQERLNGLTLIAIENDILESVDYERLINKFVAQNARRMALSMN
ncbi:zinc finger MYM-type protein 1 [Tanacetum coccineum]